MRTLAVAAVAALVFAGRPAYADPEPATPKLPVEPPARVHAPGMMVAGISVMLGGAGLSAVLNSL